jgi:hypothetical protein
MLYSRRTRRSVRFLVCAHQVLFPYVSSSGSLSGPGGEPGGAFGIGLRGGGFGRGGAPRLGGGGALGITTSVSSAPHSTHFVAVASFKAPHIGHSIFPSLRTVGGLKHIFLLLTNALSSTRALKFDVPQIDVFFAGVNGFDRLGHISFLFYLQDILGGIDLIKPEIPEVVRR